MIGLGIMGGAMARQLIELGYTVIGYDISQECLDRHTQNGGQIAKDIESLVLEELEEENDDKAAYVPGDLKKERNIPELNDSIPVDSKHFEETKKEKEIDLN